MRLLPLLLANLMGAALSAQSIAFTFDDGPGASPIHFTPRQRNEAILGHLKAAGLHSILFLTLQKGTPDRLALVRAWGEAGHGIGNHTVTHPHFHKTSLKAYQDEVLACDALIRTLPGYTKRFRFTYLKEGDTAAKRDGFRIFLAAQGYLSTPVSVDASDWYYNSRLEEALEKKPGLDLDPWRKAYLAHLWDRARYYDGLSQTLLGRSAKHVILLHPNLVNALFLGDAIRMFQEKGWKPIDAEEAFRDPLYGLQPSNLPAGESLLWALAKQQGLKGLRYPAEDGPYEKAAIDRLETGARP